jgi:hypothetical protein
LLISLLSQLAAMISNTRDDGPGRDQMVQRDERETDVDEGQNAFAFMLFAGVLALLIRLAIFSVAP